jgi:hypothetical protein
MSYTYHISRDNTITIFGKGAEQIVVPPNHVNYEEVKKYVIKKVALVEVVALLKKTVESRILEVAEKKGGVKGCTLSPDGSTILLNGEPVRNSLTLRALELKKQGFPIDTFLRFLENLSENPSARATQELYDFLDHRALPLTEDGCFLAYKAIRHDYTDIFSGKFNNSPGQTVEVPRNTVDDNRDHECSYGLHVGGSEYVRWYGKGGPIVVVKVNPKDCVAVPKDHNAQKLRVCKYEVLYEVKDRSAFELESAAYTSEGEDWDLDESYDEEDDWESEPDWSADDIVDRINDLPTHLVEKIARKLGFTFFNFNEVVDALFELQETDVASFDEIVMLYF